MKNLLWLRNVLKRPMAYYQSPQIHVIIAIIFWPTPISKCWTALKNRYNSFQLPRSVTNCYTYCPNCDWLSVKVCLPHQGSTQHVKQFLVDTRSCFGSLLQTAQRDLAIHTWHIVRSEQNPVLFYPCLKFNWVHRVIFIPVLENCIWISP